MQSGIETAQARLAAFDGGTRITISPDKSSFFGEDGLSFGDLVDAVNPLEHIPIVSTIYDALTGSKPSTAAKLAGGALMGGPIGFFASLANVIFESATGSSVEETAIAMLTGSDIFADGATELAQNTVPAATPAAANPKDAALLGLYGASAASAHQSYQQAQLRPYLKDVNSSQVI